MINKAAKNKVEVVARVVPVKQVESSHSLLSINKPQLKPIRVETTAVSEDLSEIPTISSQNDLAKTKDTQKDTFAMTTI